MKVRQLLLVGLCSMPLFACGNKDNEFAKYMVSEEEFFAAIQFKGASYLQVSRDPSSSFRTIESYSPDAYSNASYYTQTSKIYIERRVFKNGNSYSLYNFSNDKWSGPEDAPASQFESIQQKGKSFMKNLEELKIGKYEDYTFMPEKKAYHADIPPTSNDEDGAAYELFFEDKKMIGVEKILEKSSRYYTYSYEEIVVRIPDVTSNLK